MGFLSKFYQLFVLLYVVTYGIGADIISSAQIEKCNITSADQLDPNNIPLESSYAGENKLVLFLSVPNNQLEGTNIIQAQISSVVDENGNTQDLEDKLYVVLSKSESRYNYPLAYKQDFNYRPYETYVLSNYFTCNDDIYDSHPDCGWVKDTNGNNIINSQGFGCNCDLLDFIGIEDSFRRGIAGQTFDFNGGAATAHCLRWDDVYYHAYEPEEAILDYTINVAMIKQSLNTSTSLYTVTKEYMNVSTSSTIAKSDVMSTLVKIIGDLSTSQQIPSLANKVLLKPNELTSTNEFQFTMMNYWLLVDKEMVTYSGLEGNKIGVSYYAFQTQGQRGKVPTNSCLENQIYDILMKDLEKIQNGSTPEYLVTGTFMPENIDIRTSKSTQQVYLSYKTTGTQNTLLKIEMSADHLKFHTAVADGQILEAQIRSDGFEALSEDGYIDYKIASLSAFNASFLISLTDCTNELLPVPTQEISLGPNAEYDSYFNVYTTNTEELNYTGTVTLKNALGDILDSVEVGFSTTQQINETKQGGDETDVNDNPAVQEYGGGGSSCGAINLFCQFTNGCVGNILMTIFLYVGVIGFIVLTGKFGPCIYKYLFCWCGIAGKAGKKKPKKDQEDQDEKTKFQSKTKKKSKSRKDKYEINSDEESNYSKISK